MLKMVLLNYSTIEHFTIGSWEVKYFTCLIRNQSCNTFPLNSIPLSVLRENGSWSSKVLNALTTSTGDFDFIGTTCAFFEKTSTHVNKNLKLSLCLESLDTSIISASDWCPGPPAMTRRLSYFLRAGLWSVYASCALSHFSVCFNDLPLDFANDFTLPP